MQKTSKIEAAPRPQATEIAPDGLLAAVVSDDPWGAIRSLRAGMKSMRKDGAKPRARFLQAMRQDGSMAGQAGGAHMLVLGFDLQHPAVVAE